MWKKMYIKYFRSIRIRTRRLEPEGHSEVLVSDRQSMIDLYDQEAVESTVVTLIGAGGINGEVGEGLVRKGIGVLKCCDGDRVELTNLNRQLYYPSDLRKSKGLRLPVNLAPHATCGTIIEGYDFYFQNAIRNGVDLSCSVAVCGIDNNPGRIEVARHYLKSSTPVIFLAVDLQAQQCQIFIQEPNGPCWGCAFPKSFNNRRLPCRVPAAKDPLKVVAGLALYAIDTLIMPRKRAWNWRNIHLAGFAPSNQLMIERRTDCILCGRNTIHQEVKP